jgi:hypothetical protein
MDKEYCGMRTSNVKQSSRGGRSRKGTVQKPKKAHSRRSCYGTNDVSLKNTESCRRSRDNYRCVVKQKTPGDDMKADRRRAKSRAKHAARRSKIALSGGRYNLTGGENATVYMNVHENKLNITSQDMLMAEDVRQNNLLNDLNYFIQSVVKMNKGGSNDELKFFENITSIKAEALEQPFNGYQFKLLIDSNVDLSSENIQKLMFQLAEETCLLGQKVYVVDDKRYLVLNDKNVTEV